MTRSDLMDSSRSSAHNIPGLPAREFLSIRRDGRMCTRRILPIVMWLLPICFLAFSIRVSGAGGGGETRLNDFRVILPQVARGISGSVSFYNVWAQPFAFAATALYTRAEQLWAAPAFEIKRSDFYSVRLVSQENFADDAMELAE